MEMVMKRSLPRNNWKEGMNQIYQKFYGNGKDKKPVRTQSVLEVTSQGKDVSETIQQLLVEKKTALTSGDVKKARLIRRQLRRLDYKRYLQKK